MISSEVVHMKRMLIVAALAATSSVATAQGLAVTLTEFKLQLARDTVRAGKVTFQVNNAGSTSHQFKIQGPDVEKESAIIPKRQGLSMTLTLKPGTYEVYCPMSENSHKMAGMSAKLVVTAAAAPAPAKKP